MGCCCTQKQIVNNKKVRQEQIYKLQQLKKPVSIDDETFQIMEQYLNSKNDTPKDLRQNDQVGKNQQSIEQEGRMFKESPSEIKEIKQKYKFNKLFPLKCYCPNSCLCDRKEPHLWAHDVCKSALYLDLEGEVVCLPCQYSESLLLHCFACPSCGHESKFDTLIEFAQCSNQFIEDQELKIILAIEKEELEV